MFLELLILILFGIIIGIFTGLIPGIHVNLVAATLFTVSPVLLRYLTPLSLAAFIISLAITHSFLDTIPSIYLGAPENENALSVLPGHRMLLSGKGHEAVKITILGTFFGMIAAVLLIPLFMIVANIVFDLLRPHLLYLLIIMILMMIIKENKKFWSFFLFFLSGTLGIIVFSISNLKEPLFPMLSGLFGVSGLLISFFESTKIPTQSINQKIDLRYKEILKALFGSSIAVFIIQFLPGFGPAQGAVLSNQIIKVKEKTYMAMIGAMGTMSVVFSLVTFFTLKKAKDGAIVVISKLLEIDHSRFLILLLVMIISAGCAVILTLQFSKIFSILVTKVNYKFLVSCVIIFIIFSTIILSGPIGFLVLITSTFVGLIPPLKGIARNHAMGCLILPVVFYLAL